MCCMTHTQLCATMANQTIALSATDSHVCHDSSHVCHDSSNDATPLIHMWPSHGNEPCLIPIWHVALGAIVFGGACKCACLTHVSAHGSAIVWLAIDADHTYVSQTLTQITLTWAKHWRRSHLREPNTHTYMRLQRSMSLVHILQSQLAHNLTICAAWLIVMTRSHMT